LLPCIGGLERLEKGEVRPSTPLRRQFVLVCRGEIEAKRQAELKKIERQAEERDRQRRVTSVPDMPKRRIAEWGTREDYKRDRARWRTDR
jgi:uncharacterized protein YifE (UPF0438 family)